MIAVLAPLLAFSGTVVPVPIGWAATAGVLILIGLQPVAVGRAFFGRTWPALLLLCTAAIGVLVSPAVAFSLPKFFGIVLGVGIFCTLCNQRTDEGANATSRRWQFTVNAFACVGIAALAGAVALVLPRVGSIKSILGSDLLSTPASRLLSSSYGATLDKGIHPNEAAAIASLLLPGYALVLVHAIRRAGVLGQGRPLARVPAVTIAVSGVGAGLAVLLDALSLSRGAMLACCTAALVAAAWRWRSSAIVLVAALCALAIPIWLVASGHVTAAPVFTALGALRGENSTASADFRVNLWKDVMPLAFAYSWTGIGLNTLPVYLVGWTAAFPIGISLVPQGTAAEVASTDPYLLVPHAHNLLLQTALDLGLPGLAAFCAMVLLALRNGVIAFTRAPHGPRRASIAGLLLCAVAYLTFNLSDAITLGTKAGALFFVVLGLLAGAPRAADTPTAEPIANRTGWSVRWRRVSWVCAAALVVVFGPRLLGSGLTNLGLVLLQRPSDVGPSSRVLAAASAVDPGNSTATYALGLSRLAEHDEAGALAVWDGHSSIGTALVLEGLRMSQRGRGDDILPWCERAARVADDLPSGVGYCRSLSFAWHADREAEYRALEHAVRIDSGWVEPEVRWLARFVWGRAQFVRGRPSDARDILSSLADQPIVGGFEQSEMYRYLGLSQLALGEPAAASQSFERSAHADPQNRWAHIAWGEALYRTDSRLEPSAVEQFSYALSLPSADVATWQAVLLFWDQAERPDKHADICRAAQQRSVAAGLVGVCPAA